VWPPVTYLCEDLASADTNDAEDARCPHAAPGMYSFRNHPTLPHCWVSLLTLLRPLADASHHAFGCLGALPEAYGSVEVEMGSETGSIIVWWRQSMVTDGGEVFYQFSSNCALVLDKSVGYELVSCRCKCTFKPCKCSPCLMFQSNKLLLKMHSSEHIRCGPQFCYQGALRSSCKHVILWRYRNPREHVFCETKYLSTPTHASHHTVRDRHTSRESLKIFQSLIFNSKDGTILSSL
jgi:hypothetical protein